VNHFTRKERDTETGCPPSIWRVAQPVPDLNLLALPAKRVPHSSRGSKGALAVMLSPSRTSYVISKFSKGRNHRSANILHTHPANLVQTVVPWQLGFVAGVGECGAHFLGSASEFKIGNRLGHPPDLPRQWETD
jgi:hypothetical protein